MKNSNLCRGALIIAGLAGFLSIISARADTIYVASSYDGTIRQYATNGTSSIFARASLGNPEDEAFDKAGNLYVANQETTASHCTFTGLTPGVMYSATANAVGAAGPGNWSQTASQMAV